MTEITKNMKAGYQGKPDAMRMKAEKLLNHPGKADDVYYSKSCADKSKMRAYKEGGSVKKEGSEMEYMHGGMVKKMEDRVRTGASKKDKGACQKFAMGGVAKIRLKQATPQGLPIKVTKKSLKDVL
jgi:hypothetical protein